MNTAPPSEARRLTKLQTSIAEAKSQVDEAHQTWKRASARHLKARAKFREACHQTDLARIDVREAGNNLLKAEADFAPYEHLSARATRKQ